MDAENTESLKAPTDSDSGAVSKSGRELQQRNTEKKRKVHRRSQKLPALNNVGLKKKNAAVLLLRSTIPRALTLSPSCSSLPSLGKLLSLTSQEATPCSIAILNFRVRKSISQMDFKQARRNAVLGSSRYINDESKALVASGSSTERLGLKQTLDKNLKQYEYYYELQDGLPKIAGMKIFTSIMLNAWRKRRNEVKALTAELKDLKHASIKVKNQVHVVNTLFRFEKKRNDEVTNALKDTKDENKDLKARCENLNTSLDNVKALNTELEKKLQTKRIEFVYVDGILTETKSKLFKVMAKQREFQIHLSNQQRKIQTLRNHKNELIKEISNLFNESVIKKNEYLADIKKRDDEIEKLKEENKVLEELQSATKIKELCARDYAAMEAKLRNEIEMLQTEILKQKQCLDATLGSRLKKCWRNSLVYQCAMFQIMRWVAYYTLPATPRPRNAKFPYGLSLEKALSIVKR